MTASLIQGLYAITPDEHQTAYLIEQVEAALKGGVRLIQYRNKQADTALHAIQAQALRHLTQRYQAMLIINDFVELCQAVQADGVHLGGEDGSIAAARAQLGKNSLIGASCYASLERAHQAIEAGADYVAFGAVFSSSSKPLAARAPLSLFSEFKHRYPTVPCVAIGGIGLETVAQVIAAGADAYAVIQGLFGAPAIQEQAQAFLRADGWGHQR